MNKLDDFDYTAKIKKEFIEKIEIIENGLRLSLDKTKDRMTISDVLNEVSRDCRKLGTLSYNKKEFK